MATLSSALQSVNKWPLSVNTITHLQIQAHTHVHCRFISLLDTFAPPPPSAQLTLHLLTHLHGWAQNEEAGTRENPAVASPSACDPAATCDHLWQLNSLDVILILVAIAADVLLYDLICVCHETYPSNSATDPKANLALPPDAISQATGLLNLALGTPSITYTRLLGRESCILGARTKDFLGQHDTAYSTRGSKEQQ